MKRLLLAAMALLLVSPVTYGQMKSVYTGVGEKDCKTLDPADEEGYSGICPGVAGYTLELLEGDLRQTINVIAPDKKKFELELWSNVSSGFSHVGTKVEWRMKGKVPVALIMRYNASENPEDSSKLTSYLVVVKLSKTDVCIVDILKPSKTQNIDARKLADNPAKRVCQQF
ncbi:MAG: hypothetical protein ACREO2_06570 [Arenimonas sp.]